MTKFKDPELVSVEFSQLFSGIDVSSLDEDTIMEALSFEPELLRCIENPTREQCLVAVSGDGMMLRFVPEHLIDEELCRIADEQDCLKMCMKYIPEKFKTPELCEKAVRWIGYMLKYVPEHLKTKELCEIAVKRDGSLLKYVPEHLRTPELCDMANA